MPQAKRFIIVALVLFLSAAMVHADGRLAPADAFEAPALTLASPEPLYAASSTMPYGAQKMDQSAFAMGTMVWNVVFVQGNGTIQTQRETWTSAERTVIQNKISQAKSYWEGMTSSFVPGARLSIDINYVNGGNPVLTGYEPSADQSETWINSVMGQLGSYTNTNRFTNVRDFNQDQRVAKGKNWSTTLFIVDNTSASLTSYAYAYYGGPFAILENNSAGWGANNFNMVLSHEMGHIFFANDEYYASGATTNSHGGYLNVQNLNAERNPDGTQRIPPYPNALMLNNGDYYSHVPYAPSPYSSQMVGFKDSDSDGIPDILDTAPTLAGNTTGSNSKTGTFSFAGSMGVTTLPNQDSLNLGFSNSGSAMTIDTISSACYSLDGQSPIALTALDGSYGGYFEDLRLTLAGLAGGKHTIDIYGYNSVGNVSNTLSFNFTSAVPEPGTISLLAVCSIALMRRRSRT